jgi:hypothetical protein
MVKCCVCLKKFDEPFNKQGESVVCDSCAKEITIAYLHSLDEDGREDFVDELEERFGEVGECYS